ncbi:AsnC family transcriptional regulator [candidate division KSB1 bacterium]|nr:Lrp/AsnC family transcriptional regulator [candidate division KSB1 bacterium]RIK80261.1 MAG: AsnC family transcriptional regulator [candidate division KSB1 bacterium]
MSAEKLDEIDIKILKILQVRGRTKRNELAEHVKLSIPAVSERLRKMEERGVIRSYNAVVDSRKVGLGLTAFIFVMAESSVFYSQIIGSSQSEPEILECHAVTGEGSHILKIKTQSTATLEKLLSRIQSWPGVKNTRTSVVLSSPKEETVVTLAHLEQAPSAE